MYSVIVTFFLFLSVMANLVLFTLAFGGGAETIPMGRLPQFEERFVGGDTDTKNKIAVIYLTGVISSSPDGYYGEEGMVGEIRDQLKQAVEDKHVKAVILRINSPGGEVVASDAIYQAVVEARDSKPIVASMDAVGASGAYYAAVGANSIVATDMTITGSIGVILQSFTVADLMEKVGVKSYTFKSGRYKDVLNPTREPSEDEKLLVQGLIMEVYDKFVGIVATEREMRIADLKAGFADGRILTGKQAKEAGFVDEVGYFDDAVNKALALANIQKAKIVRYVRPFSLRYLARIFGEGGQSKIQIELSPNQLKLESGKLYFLPAYMFQ